MGIAIARLDICKLTSASQIKSGNILHNLDQFTGLTWHRSVDEGF
jgi:hypothetical protein